MDQVVQVAGAVLILVAFIGAQRGAMSPQSGVYLVLNVLGSAILTALAIIGHNWGFVLLEAVWTVVSLWGLAALMRGRARPGAPHGEHPYH